ncbi:MAG: type II secretion system protein N [Betaproteobacteria bacterium]
MRRALLLVLLVAVALAWQAPAWLLGREIGARSGGLVELRNAAGTLWNGEADAVIRAMGSGTRDVFVGRIGWHVERFDWARRALIATLHQTPGGARPISLTAARDRIDAAGSVRVPAALAGRIPLLAGWLFAGDIVLDSDALTWIDGAATGAALAQWRNATVVPPDLPGGFALGEVTARITLEPGGITISARNNGGDLELTADASSRSGRISLLVQPRTAAPSAAAATAQSAWLQTHTTGHTARGYTIDAGWPRR